MKKTIFIGCMALVLGLALSPLGYAESEREHRPIVNFFSGGGGSQRSGGSSRGPSSVPEPGTMVLLATGVASLIVADKLRKRK
jgi:hypothetical protein